MMSGGNAVGIWCLWMSVVIGCVWEVYVITYPLYSGEFALF